MQRLIQFSSRFVHKTIYNLYHQLLPTVCILCGCLTGHIQNICAHCFKELPSLTYGCIRCAQFLYSHDLLCGSCLKNPPPFDLTYALFPYQPPIIQLIIALKFRGQLTIAQTMGELLAHKIHSTWYATKKLPDLLIPVPLHPKRLRERGFNQALEIARPIAKSLNIPIDIHSVRRVKHTRAQSGLPANKREHNIANAFTADANYKDLTIAVIDDVITTSHTIRELCKILKQNQAKSIHIWCCARSNIAAYFPK